MPPNQSHAKLENRIKSLSDQVKGTQATLGELLAVEAGVAVDRSAEDLREAGNHVVA